MTAPLPASSSVEALYSDHHSWLRDWLRRRLSCPEQAADLAQDTFIRVLRQRNQAPNLREPRAYLSAIARGLMIDWFRRSAIERAWLDALAAMPEPIELSPEDRTLLLETLLQIDTMLDGLGSRARQIFLMAQIEGLSYVEIGLRLGVSVTTVKKHMVRALTRCLAVAEDA